MAKATNTLYIELDLTNSDDVRILDAITAILSAQKAQPKALPKAEPTPVHENVDIAVMTQGVSKAVAKEIVATVAEAPKRGPGRPPKAQPVVSAEALEKAQTTNVMTADVPKEILEATKLRVVLEYFWEKQANGSVDKLREVCNEFRNVIPALNTPDHEEKVTRGINVLGFGRN